MDYGVFAEVLSDKQISHRRAALTGEMTALAAELEHLLARAKGRTDRAVWSSCSADLARSVRQFTEAWRGRASEPDSELAFQDAVDRCRGALDVMRGELWRLGEESWTS
jgi:hypothetical protein